jgi:hypothetical protein
MLNLLWVYVGRVVWGCLWVNLLHKVTKVTIKAAAARSRGKKAVTEKSGTEGVSDQQSKSEVKLHIT